VWSRISSCGVARRGHHRLGDGQQSRSFCYVDDLVRAMLLMMDTRLRNWAINVGNPDEFTILETRGVSPAQGRRALEDLLQPLPGDDPRQRQPDITKAKALLQWQPTVSLEDGSSPHRLLPKASLPLTIQAPAP